MPKREKRRKDTDKPKLPRKFFGIVIFGIFFVGVSYSALPSSGICELFDSYFAAGKPAPAPKNTVAGKESPSAQTRFQIAFNNGKSVRARLAVTEIERFRGLMGCRRLGENEGMIFVYPTAEQRAFWMKNVPIDLDIGYFDAAGKLLEVYTMRANNTQSVYSKSDDIQYCLEMNRGWFEANGMLPNANVALDLESLRHALRERNFPQARK